jgi:ATP-dependent Clp protease ATP-binding subunit ClpA
MFERYTEKARRVVFFGRYEASQFGADAIGPEHLLLGLLREDIHLLGRLFDSPTDALDAVRREIAARVTAGERISMSVDLPLSLAAKEGLGRAQEAADRPGRRYIGTEELLLGILNDTATVAFAALRGCGVDVDGVLIRIDEIASCAGAAEKADEQIADLVVQNMGVTAKRVIATSRDEARILGAAAVEPQHLLLGLVGEDKWLLAYFGARSVSDASLRSQLSAGSGHSKLVLLSQGSADVLRGAVDAAEDLRSETVDSEHLLIGLLRSPNPETVRLLNSWGITEERVLDDLRKENE